MAALPVAVRRPAPRRSAAALDRPERLEILGRGVAQVVHDLNFPASLISGGLSNLDQQIAALIRGARACTPAGESDATLAYAIEHAPDVLRICHDGAARLARLIDELRGFVRGAVEVPATSPVDLGRVVADAVSAVLRARRSDGPPRVHVERDLPSGAMVLGDAHLLDRAFTNLVANAFEAVRDGAGTRVWIDLRDAPLGPEGNPFLEATISDDGPGIPPEARDHVFDAFFTTKRNGSGLGLAIARDIVAAHGGEIGVLDNLAPGATLVVRLPRAHVS